MPCKPNSRVLCGKDTCIICLPRSFTTAENIGWWSDRNTISPLSVSKTSRQLIWIRCAICQHESETDARTAAAAKNCEYCRTVKPKYCADDECQLCYSRSLRSHPLFAYYRPEDNDGEDARTIYVNSGKIYNFYCQVCRGTFQAKPSAKSTRKGCPNCGKFEQTRCEPRETAGIEKPCVVSTANILILENTKSIIEDVFRQRRANREGYMVLRVPRDDDAIKQWISDKSKSFAPITVYYEDPIYEKYRLVDSTFDFIRNKI